MEKTTLIIVSLVLIFLPFIVDADRLEITELLTIVGNGTIDRHLELESDPAYISPDLYENILPIYSPHGNLTSSSIFSDLEFILDDNSSIYYEHSGILQNAKYSLTNENFRLGTYTSCYFAGTQEKKIIFESAPSFTEATILSEVDGRSVLRFRVLNISNTANRHDPNLDGVTWLEGDYVMDWNALVMMIEFPEEGECDWLPCP